MIGKEYEALGSIPTGSAAEGQGKEFLRVEHASSNNISDVSINLKHGEVSGFSGLLGSGRSEIARLLFGADHATARQDVPGGQARLHPQSAGRHPS